MQTTDTQTTAAVETTSAVVAPKAPKAKKAPAEKKAPAKAPKAPRATPPAPNGATLTPSVALAFEPEILTLPISLIDEAANITRPEGRGDIKDLAASLKTLGQQTPVDVQRRGDRFVLAAGFRRIEALRSIGMETVRARVLVDSSESTRVLANVAENENSRLEITALGRYAGYATLAKEGYSIAQIASITGRANDVIRDHLRLEGAHPEVLTALAADPESAEGCVWGVARLIIRWPFEVQPRLLKKVGKMSVAAAAKALAELRAEGEAPAKKTSSTGSDADEGSDEGEGDETEGLSVEKVARLTVPFFGLAGDTVAALRQAVANGDLGAVEKIANVLAKEAVKQEKGLRRLLGDATFEAAAK